MAMDWSVLGDLGSSAISAYGTGRKQRIEDQQLATLASLGQTLQGTNPDYVGAQP